MASLKLRVLESAPNLAQDLVAFDDHVAKLLGAAPGSE
jgi:hypothetical protein